MSRLSALPAIALLLALPVCAQVKGVRAGPAPSASKGIIVQGGLQVRPTEAIGPKQDDPRNVDCTPGGHVEAGGFVRPGGDGDPQAIGPKQDDPRRALAIGPKQDDPSRPGGLAIGPKQDDPSRPGMLAIGPKQDDPRAPAAVGLQGRPGDDDDPQARCRAAVR